MEGIYVKEFELGINDVDKNNKMKLSTYLKFMQEIGALHSKVYGYCLDTEPITHKAWVVIAWNVDILDKPSWNEKIIVKTWIGKIDKIYFYRYFEMTNEKGEVVAKAKSQWIMIDTCTKKIQKITSELLSEFPKVHMDGYSDGISKVNLKFDKEKLEKIYECSVQKRDVDTNNHMNNIIYLDLALEGLDDTFCDNIKNVEIHYKTECKLGEKIVFMKNEENNVYILDENEEKVHTLVMLNRGE